MSLTIFQAGNGINGLQQSFGLMQTSWASQLNPLLALPLNSGILLKSVSLLAGSNTVNHLLGRKIQGYIPTRYQNGWANFYDTQSTNQNPTQTLVLVASANVVVDLFVF